MLVGSVLVTKLDGATTRHSTGSNVAAMIRPNNSGEHLVVTENSLISLNLNQPDSRITHVVDLTLPSNTRANEGTVAIDDGLYVGTMAWDESRGAGKVIHIKRNLVVEEVLGNTTVSNGMVLEDEGTMLFIDSPKRTVSRYQLDEKGRWVQPQIVVDLAHWKGVPDGMCVDSEGGMWIAHWDGYEVCRFSSDGYLAQTFALPTARPTSCALGVLN
jgi:sugar lactone lactonase YvrE